MAKSIQSTDDGGCIVAGYSASNDGDVHGNPGEYDIWILKLDAAGDTIWTRTYGESSISELANDIRLTNDGGYIVVGSSNNHYGHNNILSMKLDENGDVIWSKVNDILDVLYSVESAQSVCETPDGDFIVVGHNYNIGQWWFLGDAFILMLNSDGDSLWSKVIGKQEYDVIEGLLDIHQTLDGGFIACGYNELWTNEPGDSLLIVKLNNLGEISWSKSLEIDDFIPEEANSIIQTSDSSYIVAGHSSYPNKKYMMLKLTKTGEFVISKEFGGSLIDIANSVINSIDGGIIITGKTQSNDGDVYGNHGDYDFWVVKLDGETFDALNPTTLPLHRRLGSLFR